MRNIVHSIPGMILVSQLVISCAIPMQDDTGSINHIIIGFGVVKTTKPNSIAGVLAINTKIIGLQVSDQPGLRFALGYSDSSVVLVPETTQNIVVEITQPILGPLTVEINPTSMGGTNDHASKEACEQY